MNKEKMKFWTTCPECKRKFGVELEIVLKYIDRIFGELDKEFKKIGEDLGKSEKEAKKREL